MHPLPTWRLGHLIVPVSRARWSDAIEHLSFDVQGEFIEYLMGRPSLSGAISVGTEHPIERLGHRVRLTMSADDDLSLYTGIHVRPKALAVTIEEVDGQEIRAKLEGIADIEWDESVRTCRSRLRVGLAPKGRQRGGRRSSKSAVMKIVRWPV
jgi:hypothetical protein